MRRGLHLVVQRKRRILLSSGWAYNPTLEQIHLLDPMCYYVRLLLGKMNLEQNLLPFRHLLHFKHMNREHRDFCFSTCGYCYYHKLYL